MRSLFAFFSSFKLVRILLLRNYSHGLVFVGQIHSDIASSFIAKNYLDFFISACIFFMS